MVYDTAIGPSSDIPAQHALRLDRQGRYVAIGSTGRYVRLDRGRATEIEQAGHYWRVDHAGRYVRIAE
jgi:hypothetical protein